MGTGSQSTGGRVKVVDHHAIQPHVAGEHTLTSGVRTNGVRKWLAGRDGVDAEPVVLDDIRRRTDPAVSVNREGADGARPRHRGEQVTTARVHAHVRGATTGRLA